MHYRPFLLLLAFATLAPLPLRHATAEEDQVETLTGLVLGDDEPRAEAAAKALGKMGPAARAAAPTLRRALQERDGDLQRNAAWALKKMDEDLSNVVPDLLPFLDSEAETVRARGARALGLTRSPRPDALKKLKKLVRDPSQRVRAAAANALHQWNEGYPVALGVLRKLWSSEDRAVSYLALEGLVAAGLLGKKAALRSLLEALEHENAKIRRQAAVGLVVVARARDVPIAPLAKALEDEAPGVRIAAALALAMSGKRAVPAAPALIQALTDSEPNVAGNAALALTRMGKDALPELSAWIEDVDPRIRAGIAVILGEMEEAPEEAIRILEELGDDELTSVRKAAQNAIRTLREKMAADRADGDSPSD